MYERFTRDAKLVLVLAQEEVRALGSEVAGTEHLLLALTRVDAWVRDLLHGVGVTYERLRREVAPGLGTPEMVPLGPDFKAAVAAAARQADDLGRSGVGPEHLLLGVLDVGGLAEACLHELGLKIDDVRLALLAVGSGPGDEDDPQAAPLFPIAPPIPADETEGMADVLGGAAVQPRCPSCRNSLADVVRHLRVPVDIEVTVDLVYCGRCGHSLTTRIVERF